MALNAYQAGSAILATTTQPAASEIWHAYVPSIMPGLGGPNVTYLFGVACAIIVAHFIPQPKGT